MTLGPFFPREFAQGANDLTTFNGKTVAGEGIEIIGRVIQGDGKPMDNAVLEVWQANAAGRIDDPAFLGWGRAATDANGVYSFRTIKPGAIDGRAPHVNFLVLFSGLMRQLQTVMFFDAGRANDTDPVFSSVNPPALRSLLVARREGKGVYRFDIRTRGEGETPFFED
jgi:protocatechuate 3,4-dioxygenase alpha subunit